MTSPIQSPPPPSFRQHLQAGLSVLAATAVLFSFTWGKALFYRDLLRWSFPMISFLQQSLKAGELPLWNPYLYMGYPYLAEMANAVLYPLSLLLLPFPVPFALKLYPAVHYFLTGCLMWRLLREWRLNQAAALFGALVWMCSGYLVSMHLNFNYLIPAAWYPGLLFCGHRLLHTRRLGWLFATGLVWAMIFLGGDPQAFLFAGVLLLLYLGAAQPLTLPALRRHLPLLALAGALSLLLVLAQALPSLEFGALCTKLKGFDFQSATRWSHHPARWLEWIWPELWGPLFPARKFWARFLGSYSFGPWAGAVYLGLFPLGLALTQCRRYREPLTRFLLLTLALFFLLALGYYSPLYRLLWTLVPPYRIFRFPEKHLAPATLSLAGLAALGFQRLLDPEQDSARRAFLRGWVGLTVFLAAVFAALFFSIDALTAALVPYVNRLGDPLEPGPIRASLLNAAWRAPAVAAVFLLVWLLARQRQGSRRWLAPALVALTCVDLLAVGRDQLVLTDPSLYTFEPAAARMIRKAQAGSEEPFRFRRVVSLLLPPRYFQPAQLSEAERSVFWGCDTLLGNSSLPLGLFNLMGEDPAVLDRINRFSLRPVQNRVFEMLNVKYVVDGAFKPEIETAPEFSGVGLDPERNLRVLLDHNYFPRAYFVDGVRPAWDPADALHLLNTADLRHQVVLVHPPSGLVLGRVFLPARIQSYRNREVVLEMTNPVPGYLILSDVYFPGWQARVDGRPTRILSANYLVRAVPLEPGSHRVVFTYRPWPWRLGATVSLCSLCLLPFALLLRRRFGAPRQP